MTLKTTRHKVAVLIGAALLALSLLIGSPSAPVYAGDCPVTGAPGC